MLHKPEGTCTTLEHALRNLKGPVRLWATCFTKSDTTWAGMHQMSTTMYRGTYPNSPDLNVWKGSLLLVCLTWGRSLRFDVWLGVTSSRTPHSRKAYHIQKVLVRTSTKVTLSSLCISFTSLAEVCFDGTFLWACLFNGCFFLARLLWHWSTVRTCI